MHGVLTQEEVAKRLGISKQLLSRYERGHDLPSIRQTIRIAEVLQAPVEAWIHYRIEDERLGLGYKSEVKIFKAG